MSSQHDLADYFQLRSTEGWQNLLVILQSTGERAPKRSREPETVSRASSSSSFQAPGPATSEPLAKRFAAFRLNERSPSSHQAPQKWEDT